MSTFNFYSQNNPILLSTEKLDIGYGADILIKELTLNIRHGEIIALIGENGSGKSTLIRTLAGLQNPLAGRIALNEIPIQQVSMHDKAKMMASVSTITTENIMLTGYKFVSHGRYPYIGWNGRLRAIDHDVIDLFAVFEKKVQTAVTNDMSLEYRYRGTQIAAYGEELRCY